MPVERTRDTSDTSNRRGSVGGRGAGDGNHTPMALGGPDARFRSYRNQGFASPSGLHVGSLPDSEAYPTYSSRASSSSSGSYSSYGTSPFPSPLSGTHASLSSSGPTTPSSFGVPSPCTSSSFSSSSASPVPYGYTSLSPYPGAPSTNAEATHASPYSDPSIFAPSLSRTRIPTAADPAPNAFIMFRAEYCALHPPSAGEKIDQRAISKKLGEIWGKMGKEEKAVYRERAEVGRERHALEFPHFNYDANVKNRNRSRVRMGSENGAEMGVGGEGEGVELSEKEQAIAELKMKILRRNIKPNVKKRVRNKGKEKEKKKEIKAGQDGRTRASTSLTEGYYGVFRMEHFTQPPAAPSVLEPEPPFPFSTLLQPEAGGRVGDGDATGVIPYTKVIANTSTSHLGITTADTNSISSSSSSEEPHAILDWADNTRLLPQMSQSQSRYTQYFLSKGVSLGVVDNMYPVAANDHQPLEGYQQLQARNITTGGQALGQSYYNPMFNPPTAYSRYINVNSPSDFPASFYAPTSVQSNQASHANQLRAGGFNPSQPFTGTFPPIPPFTALETPNYSIPQEREYNDFRDLDNIGNCSIESMARALNPSTSDQPHANSMTEMAMAEDSQPAPPLVINDNGVREMKPTATYRRMLSEFTRFDEDDEEDVIPGYFRYDSISSKGNAGPNQPSSSSSSSSSSSAFPSSSHSSLAYALGGSSNTEGQFVANERHRPLAMRRSMNLPPGPGPPSGSSSSSSSVQRQPANEFSGFGAWGRGRNGRR